MVPFPKLSRLLCLSRRHEMSVELHPGIQRQQVLSEREREKERRKERFFEASSAEKRNLKATGSHALFMRTLTSMSGGSFDTSLSAILPRKLQFSVLREQ